MGLKVMDSTRVRATRFALAVVLASGFAMLMIGSSARAAALPPSTFGAQVPFYDAGGQLGPSNLQLAEPHGVGTARYGVFNSMSNTFDGYSEDQVVAFLARMHMRLYPILGVVCSGCANPSDYEQSPTPSVAAGEMSAFIEQFAQRYGEGGSFWKANPTLPYEPVVDFEIGNEPNLPLQWVVDSTHLHYQDKTDADSSAGPGQYAQVYEAAEQALHAVDPSGVAVVGGLGDSAKLEVDVPHAALYVKAIQPSMLDAVGYHAWVFDVSDDYLEPDTQELRDDMDSYGDAGVPIQVSETGACDLLPGTSVDSNCPKSQTSEQWGSEMAAYTRWAVCTPSLHVDNIDAYLWGGTPDTAQNAWLPLVDSTGAITPYGSDYFGQASALTTSGCPSTSGSATPATAASPPTISGTPVVGQTLTADPGKWNGSWTFHYEWDRCDATGANCSSIGAGNAPTYTATPDDIGSSLLVRVIVVADGSTAGGSAESAPTAVVTAATTTTGLSTSTPAPGTTTSHGKTSSTKKPTKRSMGLRLIRVQIRGHRVTMTVRHAKNSGQVIVTVTRLARKHPRPWTRRSKRESATFVARLSPGRWKVVVRGRPAKGYAVPKSPSRRLTVKR